jgi:DNA-binding transcriptional ArsR family regulator
VHRAPAFKARRCSEKDTSIVPSVECSGIRKICAIVQECRRIGKTGSVPGFHRPIALFTEKDEYRRVNLDHTLIAFADPTRRAILQRLSRGEARVTELAEPFDISLNSVSKHIRILERADLVRRRVSGREHFLTFNPAPMESAVEWMERHRIFWTSRLDALEAALRAEDAVAAAKKKSTHPSSKRSKK